MITKYILIYVSCLNIILALIMLLYNWRNNKNILYLTLFLIFYSFNTMTGSILVSGGSKFLFAILLNNFAPLYYLLPVMLYFYIRGVINDKFTWSKTDFLHFIPFFINVIAVLPYLVTTFEYKYSIAEKLMCNLEAYKNYDFMLFYPQIINKILRLVLFSIYLCVSILLIVKQINRLKHLTGFIKKQSTNMVIFLSLVIVVFTILTFSCSLLTYQMIKLDNFDDFLKIDSMLLKGISFFYILIPIYFLLNPGLIYGLPQKKEENINNLNIPVKKTICSIELKEKNIVDENETFKLLSNKIIKYIEEEKSYLNTDFSVHDLCINMNIPRHHLQYCLNEIIGKSFSDIKNEMRIKHATELMESGDMSKLSLEGIGKISGYLHNSSFYINFQKITGYTPSKWLEMKGKKSDNI